MNGFVHSFESLAAVDGQGLRCALFLSGCPLRCAYCHNPDTWQPDGGKETKAEDIVRKIVRYKPYFGADGGVTFTGGEPLCQAKFINEVSNQLKDFGVGYVVDTSGFIPLDDNVKKALSNSQHVILDLKFWDNDAYIKYTKVGIDPILKTLNYLESIGKPTWIRTVIIPGINDSEEILDLYMRYLTGKKCVEKYELLAFHTMGFYKYDKLGIQNLLADKQSLETSVKERLQSYVNSKLFK